ncbi:Transmembrane protein 53, partial [Operophtera brumata]
MLSWLASKQKHLSKYAEIYTQMGFDVMTITCSPLQVMFPARGSQVGTNTNTNNTDKKLQIPSERPLCIMLSWLASKQKHLSKYAEIYTQMGFDVMTITCSPLQVMFPARGSQIKCLGGKWYVYYFSYQPVLDRVVAQVWDSPADVEELPVGLPLSLFPGNKLLQKAITAYARAHMWLLYRVATQHYWRATQAYHEPPCRAPALFLLSTADPVGAATRSRRAHASMTALGIK